MTKKRGNGEGSITKRKDGSWMGRITIGRNPDGKLKRQCVYGKTRAEVSEKLNKVINELNSGTYVEPSKITVSEWLNTWLWEYKRQSLKPTSFTRYEICVRVHINPLLGKLLLRDIRPVHIQKLINLKSKENQSSRSIKYIYTTLHNALDIAYKNGIVQVNSCKAVVLPKQQKKEIRILTLDEQEKLMKAIKGHRYELAFILDLYTGLRLSELLALKWENIDFNEGVIKVSGNIQRIRTYVEGENKTSLIYQSTTKTKAGKRTIPLLDELVVLIQLHKEKQDAEKDKAEGIYKDEGYIFCNEIGQCIEPRRMTVYFNKVIERAGLGNIGITFHALRHTFATRGLENGINPKVMHEILGHTSITMTLDLYSHVLPDIKKDAINKLKDIFKSTIE